MAATASMEALNQATQVERDRQDNELYENGFVLALDRLFDPIARAVQGT
jgi:hypothetical protein